MGGIAEIRARHDANRRTAVGLASQVGKALKAAGFAKASAYSPWGREKDGYEVHASYSSTRAVVNVFVTFGGDSGVDMLEGLAAELQRVGFTVTVDGRRAGTHLPHLVVTR